MNVTLFSNEASCFRKSDLCSLGCIRCSLLFLTQENMNSIWQRKKEIALWCLFISINFLTTKWSLERSYAAVVWLGLWGLLLIKEWYPIFQGSYLVLECMKCHQYNQGTQQKNTFLVPFSSPPLTSLLESILLRPVFLQTCRVSRNLVHMHRAAEGGTKPALVTSTVCLSEALLSCSQGGARWVHLKALKWHLNANSSPPVNLTEGLPQFLW